MRLPKRLVVGVVLLAATLPLLAPPHLRAENWPQWRGPLFDGATTESNLPASWSTTENVAWATPMPGRSSATPAIWGDHIFVSSPDSNQDLLLLCLSRKDGKVLWQKTVAEGNRSRGLNNMASPSPVTDGKLVVAMFGTGDVAAFDFSGAPLWSRNLCQDYGRFQYNFLYGSSPLLYRGKLYVQVLNRPPEDASAKASDGLPMGASYLLCLDPATGKTLWRQGRPTAAREESQEAYTTPIPKPLDHGKSEILVVGGNCTSAHDAATGEELWRCGGLNARDRPDFRVIPSPVVADGVIVSCAPKHEPVFGIREGGGAPARSAQVAWTFSEFPSDCVTPLYYQRKLFVLDGDKQMMTCLDPQTGEKKWQGSLGGREIFRSSPTGADGKIYCLGEKGTVVILSAGQEFKVLGTIPMGGEPARSEIAVSGGQIFIRTAQNLYCISRQ